MRECSRKRPTSERTRIRSDSPRTPGRRQQIPAHDEIDFDPCVRSRVERLDDLGILEAVHLEDDAAIMRLRFLVDLREQRRAQARRRDEELAVPARSPAAGQEVEQLGEVRSELARGGQQTHVFIGRGGDRIVVPGPDVAVAGDSLALAAHHERDLPVRLEAHEAVDDVHAGLLEGTRPLDVRFFVEASLELDERHHLLASLRRSDQREGHRIRGSRGPVEGVLDRQHVRIRSGLCEERLDRGLKRIVGMVHQHISLLQHFEEVGGSALGTRGEAPLRRRPARARASGPGAGERRARARPERSSGPRTR